MPELAQSRRVSSIAERVGGIGHLVLVRHGSTPWSTSGQHTGRTDIELDEEGKKEAIALGPTLSAPPFDLVLSSPLKRALETCQLSGVAEDPILVDALMEWDYGDYEGLRTAEIRLSRPDWEIFRDGCPNGESAADVGARVDALLEDLHIHPDAKGSAVLFAHGHLLRVLVARYLELSPENGRRFVLDPAHRANLGFERETRVLHGWNL